jgi:hypothetical protein
MLRPSFHTLTHQRSLLPAPQSFLAADYARNGQQLLQPRSLRGRLANTADLKYMSFVAAWELQSQIATVVLVALVALAPLWVALGVMIAWSLTATVTYFVARRRGLPDLLEIGRPDLSLSGQPSSRLLALLMLFAIKVWFVGLQAYVYSKTLCPVLDRKDGHRMARLGVVAMGLTLFGVSASQHMLGRAGYESRRALALGFLGSFLNVPYRVLLSATVVHTTMGLLHLLTSPTPLT